MTWKRRIRWKSGDEWAETTGLGVLGVALTALLSWKHIAARYYLHQLISDSAYLLEILENPEDSPEGTALNLFLRTREGKEALFAAYAEETIRRLAKDTWDRLLLVETALIWLSSESGHLAAWAPQHTGWIRVSDLDNWGNEATARAMQRAVPATGLGGMNDMPDPETFACVVTRKPEATLDALAARLRHAEERVRLAAAVDLLASGKEAEAAIPALAGALADQNEAVRVTAAKALGMMGRPAIAVLTRALRHKSVVVRKAAERPEEAHGIDPRSAASLSSRRPPPEVA